MAIVNINSKKSLIPPESVIRFQGGLTSITISDNIYIVFLDARGSNDPDGTISSYIWEISLDGITWNQIGGTTIPTLQKTIKISGTYRFRVKVIDNDGLETYSNIITLNYTKTTIDDITAYINGDSVPFYASIPIYNNIQLSAIGSYIGTGADSIVSYSWEWVSGPDPHSFTSYSNPVTVFTPNLPGLFTLQLEVTNNLGHKDTNLAYITVTGSL